MWAFLRKMVVDISAGYEEATELPFVSLEAFSGNVAAQLMEGGGK